MSGERASTDEDLILSIRAQYHFRDSPEGLLAWDVRRLVRRSRGLPVQAVPLAQITERCFAAGVDGLRAAQVLPPRGVASRLGSR